MRYRGPSPDFVLFLFALLLGGATLYLIGRAFT